MIKLVKITIQNFMSYGNSPTTFMFDGYKFTLIRGKNGSGKSTIVLDAVIFALYGRAYRDINKNQLINSINKTGLLVDLDFEIGNDKFKIVRGIKPNVFDIFKNDSLIEQNAAVKDYQEYLEKQILRVGEKTFKQVAILGSSSYVPFMKLRQFERRELVDSLMNIEVFTDMYSILRERSNITKDELKEIERKIELAKHDATAQLKLISVLRQHAETKADDFDAELKEHNDKLVELTKKIESLKSEYNFIVASTPTYDIAKYTSLTEEYAVLKNTISTTTKRLSEIEHMISCPTCSQNVSEDHKRTIRDSADNVIATATTRQEDVLSVLSDLSRDRKKSDEMQSSAKTVKFEIAAVQHQYDSTMNNISKIESKKSVSTETVDIASEELKLSKIKEHALSLIETKRKISEEKQIQEVAQVLLKDSGIKTAVISEYLPVLNQLINNYLAKFEFFVEFTLDENFNEVIKSRGRDSFSYSSFSEGEKKKLDFAILMAFRQLASMKNSVKTNLLVLDEILDDSLDIETRAKAQEIVTSIPDANVIVVSHAETSNEGFDRTIVVDKIGDFSVYHETD